MNKDIQQQTVIEALKGARTVNFTQAVLETYRKMEMVRADVRSGDKAAKSYLESVEQQYRNQMRFLFVAARDAFPEDGIDPNHAMSSLGPESILEHYDFQVIVARKDA